MEKVYKYYAFISYKHADEKWAKWLQKQLETYRLPVALQKQNFPKTLKPIFRDNTDLAPGNLEEKLKESLELSRYLIVICSRNLARESHYIDFEMQTFQNMGRGDKIIPFIVDGEPNAKNPEDECFSDYIKGFPGELLAANAVKDGKRIAALKVIAAILNLDADDLIKRDRKRLIRQRFLSACWVVTAAILLSTTLRLLAQNYEKTAENAYFYSDTSSAIENAVKSLRIPFQRNAFPNAAVILRNEVLSNELKKSNAQFHKDYYIKAQNKGVTFFGESADGSMVAFSDYSRIYVYDSEKGSYLREFKGMLSMSAEEKQEFADYFGVTYNADNDEFDFANADRPEQARYMETIEEWADQEILHIQDVSGNVGASFYIQESSAEWTYNEREDMIAVYPEEGDPYIYVYAFDHDFCFRLTCPGACSGVSEMRFSPKSRYLFADYYTRTPDGFYGDNTLCVYDLESREMIFERSEDRERNSILAGWHLSGETLYLFPAYGIEKYSFTDREPEIIDHILYRTESGDEIAEKNPNPESIHFSQDGTKAVTIHNFYTNDKCLYTFFRVHTGEKLKSLLFAGYHPCIDITPDIRYAFYYLDDHVYLCDLESDDILLDVDCQGETVCSVAISRDGTCAAYINEEAVITIFRLTDGTYQKHTIHGCNADGEKLIVCMNNEECFVNSDQSIRAYNMETGEMRLIAEGVYQSESFAQNDFDVFKSLRDLDDFDAILCDVDIEQFSCFMNKDGGEIDAYAESEFGLLNANYCPQNRLLVGTEHTNQMQYNSQLTVIQVDRENSNVLYRYVSKIEITELCFDNQGKYIIINGRDEEGCEVLDARTGELLFSLDRNIRIHDDVVYDVSGDLVLPDALPHAEICSVNEFIKKGITLIG